MIQWLIYNAATGAELRREAAAEPTLEAGEAASQIPASHLATPTRTKWSVAARGWVDVRRLTGLQILALYTPAQHARMRRMLFATFPATYPVGHPQAGLPHPQAGQLVDPDGLAQRLADATLAMSGTIAVTDPLHVNGTAFNRAAGIIESDQEAARIAAGITPEEWAAGVRS